MFIEISKSSIERIDEFIYHHNNWRQFFSMEEAQKIWDNDEVPGEELVVIGVKVRKYEDNDYWFYLGNHGGSNWTVNWAEKYFPDIKVYTSCDFKYNDEDWLNWETVKIEDFKNDYKEKIKLD